MKIVQVDNFKVSGKWELESLPPEFQDHIGTIYHILEPFQQEVDIGWRYEGGDFLPPIIIPTNYGTKITKLAFLTRLGDAVLGAIEAASRVNNPLGYAAAVIKIKHASSTYIDLALPETHTDIQKLVDYGFIDVAKMDAVINNPVTEKEVPLFISSQVF